MDDPAVPRAELEESLGYIRLVNRRLGGVSALLKHLKRWSAHWPRDRAVTLIDIATGSGDLPLAARAWARESGFDLRVVGVDLHETTVDIARGLVRETLAREGDDPEAVRVERADALKLMDRFGPGSFDYAHAGLFLHHLPEIEVLTVLRIMERLGRAGLVWNDLVRSSIGYAAIHLLTVGKPHIVKHDARVSVAAGFTKPEVLAIRRRLDLGWCRYEWNPFTHRFTLAGEKPGVW